MMVILCLYASMFAQQEETLSQLYYINSKGDTVPVKSEIYIPTKNHYINRLVYTMKPIPAGHFRWKKTKRVYIRHA